MRPLSRTLISRTSTCSITSFAASSVCPKPETRFLSGGQAPWSFLISNHFHSLTDTRFPKRRPSLKSRRKRASIRPPGSFFILNLTLLIWGELLLTNYLLDMIALLESSCLVSEERKNRVLAVKCCQCLICWFTFRIWGNSLVRDLVSIKNSWYYSLLFKCRTICWDSVCSWWTDSS